MFSFAEWEHTRSYHAAKIQNIFDMVVTLQPFLVKFTRFLLNNHKKHIKNNLSSYANNIYICYASLPQNDTRDEEGLAKTAWHGTHQAPS